MREFFEAGTARLGKRDPNTGERPITYLQPGTIANIKNGTFLVTGTNSEGALELSLTRAKHVTPRTVWNQPSHFARDHGSTLLNALLGEKRFDFPKALYAVEDALRFFLTDKAEGVVIDFFSGSGTTAHAVMRLNKQDGGAVNASGNQQRGGCRRTEGAATRPASRRRRMGAVGHLRLHHQAAIKAAIPGKTPDGEKIKGDYKFTDEFPMADGFKENAEFFTLPTRPRSGCLPSRVPDRSAALDACRHRGPANRDSSRPGGRSSTPTECSSTSIRVPTFRGNGRQEDADVRIAYIVTDEDRFPVGGTRVSRGHGAVRLYKSYLPNFGSSRPRDCGVHAQGLPGADGRRGRSYPT